MKQMFEILIAFFVIVGLIIRPIVMLVEWVYRLIKGRKNLNTHGDADVATDRELKKKGYFEPRGFLMCFTESGKAVFSKPDKSVMVLAGPGQGKSQTVIANFRAKARLPIERRQHLMVFDPANELYEVGAPILKSLGYVVEKIDLIDPSKGIHYDILSYLDPRSANFDTDLKGLCELLVPPEPNSRQPHFVDYARIMLADVITLNMVFEGNKRSLAHCIDEILVDTKRQKMMERMKKYPYDFKAIGIFDKMSGNEGTSMLSTALRKLNVWGLGAIREISRVEEGRGWTFEEFLGHDQPSVLFVRTGLRPGGGEYARAVFGNAVNTMRRVWDNTGLANPRGLQMFIDEAARLQNCTALMDGHNELRKAGCSIFLSFLSFAALKDIYGAEAMTMFNGCDHIIFPGNKDMETNELYSRMIGDMTIESGSRNESSYGGESRGLNEQARRKFKADEIRRLPYEDCLAIVDSLTVKGKKVFRMKKGQRLFR